MTTPEPRLAKLVHIDGNLFDHVTDGYIAHGVNCMGKMGSGFAKVIREKYPDAYTWYMDLCRESSPQELLGRRQFVPTPQGPTIINVFSQLRYTYDGSRVVSYDAIRKAFAQIELDLPINTVVNMPRIGAGLGGGDWKIIEQAIRESAPSLVFHVYTPSNG